MIISISCVCMTAIVVLLQALFSNQYYEEIRKNYGVLETQASILRHEIRYSLNEQVKAMRKLDRIVRSEYSNPSDIAATALASLRSSRA